MYGNYMEELMQKNILLHMKERLKMQRQSDNIIYQEIKPHYDEMFKNLETLEQVKFLNQTRVVRSNPLKIIEYRLTWIEIMQRGDAGI